MNGGTPERRSLGLWTAVLLVCANMIGAGVFTTSGYSLAELGRPSRVLWAWVVGGLFATTGALSYGALARRIPRSGGEYTFLARAYHPFVGFLGGWISLWAGFSAPTAVAALGLQSYLDSSFEIGGDPRWIGTCAILVAALLHGLRLRPGVIVQNLVVTLKLGLILGFCVLGAALLPEADVSGADELPTAAEPLAAGAFAVALVWISFAYSGWNAAVYVAGEVREPERNLPRALLIGTGLVTGLYLALNAVFLFSGPAAELAGQAEVGAIAAEALGGPGLRRFAAALVAFALFTSVSSMVMAGPRVYARMAEDGYLPRVFRYVGDAPGGAVALQTVLALVFVWSTDLRRLLSYVGLTLGLSAAATVAGLLRLRWREGARSVPIPGYPLVPLVFVVGTVVASTYLVSRQPLEGLFFAVTLATGAVAYLVARRRPPVPPARP